jgi:hypothetical protein
MTAARIRWEQSEYGGSLLGYAGTFDGWLFQIFKASDDIDDGTQALMATLPGALGDYRYKIDLDELKAEAERWLEEFTASIGAVFLADAFEFEEDDEPLEVRYGPGAFVRYQHPDAGWPGEQDEARSLLTHGRLYRVAWNDIGQSKTRIGLVGVEGAGFNSVLFEPVASEDVTDAEADEVARRQTTAAMTAREKE